MHSTTHEKRPSPTLYKSEEDLKLGLSELVKLISDSAEGLPQDEEGFYPIKFLCDALKAHNQRLYYINRNHIVEFFFKDLAREIQFKGENQMRYDAFKTVDQNEILCEGMPLATLFNSPTDLSAALIQSVHLLKNKAPGIICDAKGYCKVTDLCAVLKTRMPFLSYIGRNHIVELFFKDKQRKIIFNGPDLVKYKIKRMIEPPDVLYFGTLQNLARKMAERGIYSGTKRYIKLYADKSKAVKFASKFATQAKDKTVALPIDAKKAYENGVRFSSYEEGEFVVSQIDKEFIKWPEKELNE